MARSSLLWVSPRTISGHLRKCVTKTKESWLEQRLRGRIWALTPQYQCCRYILLNCLSFKTLWAGGTLFALAACTPTTETVTELISKPQKTSFSSSTDQEVCENALDPKGAQAWNTATDAQEAVVEAEHRTLTPKACARFFDRIQRGQETVELSEDQPSAASVCIWALAEGRSNDNCDGQRTWETNPGSQRHVNEAKSLGLTANECCKILYPTLVKRRTASGTGFLINNQGHMLTSNHVVEECSKIEVRHGDKMHIAKIIESDNRTDLALLQVNFNEAYRTLSLSSKDPDVMDEIYAAGYPHGDEGGRSVKVTSGIVSASSGPPVKVQEDQNPVQVDAEFFLQHDAAINPGNSGGPLINKSNGTVVGVIYGKFKQKNGGRDSSNKMNYAIKVSVLTRFLKLHRIPFGIQSTRESIGERLKKIFRSRDVAGRDVRELVEDSTLYVSCSELTTE